MGKPFFLQTKEGNLVLKIMENNFISGLGLPFNEGTISNNL